MFFELEFIFFQKVQKSDCMKILWIDMMMSLKQVAFATCHWGVAKR